LVKLCMVGLCFDRVEMQRMKPDPKGYYRLLGVDPEAGSDEITHAFRAKAKILHPDVPWTGSTEAFVRLKEAYDVLSDAARRAVYDRVGLAASVGTAPVFRDIYDDGPDLVYTEHWRLPRGLPLYVALTLILLVGFAGLQVVSNLTTPQRRVTIPDTPSASAPEPPKHVDQRPPEAADAGVGAAPTHYVIPGRPGPAVLWRYDDTLMSYVPAGQLADFSTVVLLQLVPNSAMAEVRVPAGAKGFVYASRLMPGDAAEAHKAYCTYNAGAPLQNDEVLARKGDGPNRVVIENHDDQAAVFKLRDETQATVLAVAVTPHAMASVDSVPGGRLRPEFARGDLWSRACRTFVAGMRAEQFAGYAVFQGGPKEPGGTARFELLPDSKGAVDLPDDAFNRD
jgi:DnaJ domain